MDRRAKKLEQKRKNRALAEKRAAVAGKGNRSDSMVRSAAKQPFGPCFVSRGWDDTASPELVSVIVTRKLASGLLLPGLALVDRTCLGVKSGFVAEPLAPHELRRFVEQVGTPHGGMDECAPMLVQSIVFHALDYARSLGFEPDPDFKVSLFEPRPSELLATTWSAPKRPNYAFGPNDDVRAITKRLEDAVGPDGYDFVDPFAADAEADDAEELDEPWVRHRAPTFEGGRPYVSSVASINAEQSALSSAPGPSTMTKLRPNEWAALRRSVCAHRFACGSRCDAVHRTM